MPTKFFQSSESVQSALDSVLDAAWERFPQLAPNQIALTWITYEPPYRVNTGGALSAEEFWQYRPQGVSYRGVELIEPAGMVSLFYLVAAHVWLEQGMLQSSPELVRAMADMIRGSADAMSYVVDALSGVTSGPELQPGPTQTWQYQRNIVNRYYQQLAWPELRGVNLNQKVWCDRPYGRERDFLGDARENQNLLSTEAVARLLHSIVGGVSVSGVRSHAMMNLLKQSDHQSESSDRERWTIEAYSRSVSYRASYTEVSGAWPYLLTVSITSKGTAHNKEILTWIEQQILEKTIALFS